MISPRHQVFRVSAAYTTRSTNNTADAKRAHQAVGVRLARFLAEEKIVEAINAQRDLVQQKVGQLID